MGKLEDYRACMSGKMKGKQFAKGERKKHFCATASVCSGKSRNEEEGMQKCKIKHPDW